MTHQDQATATSRLQEALLAFRAAESLLLAAERRLKGLSAEEVEAFWSAPGGRIERHVQASAAEVVAAFKVFSAAGLVASAEDRHRVSAAERHLAEGAA
jgi:Tfp pilus assembly protein PilX